MRRLFLALLLFAAPALADPVKDTRQIMAGTVTTLSIKQAYLSGARDNTTAFQGALKAYKAVRAAELPAPAPVPTPVPAPCPTGTVLTDGHCKAPAPIPAPVPTGLSGEASIADSFDPLSWLIPGERAGGVAAGDVGAFRFTCLSGQVSRDDPIVYPGQPGKSHLHQFFGNTGTNGNSDYRSLRTTGGSTCTRSATESPQRSAYWMPAMLDGVGNAVKPDWINTYYKQLPASSPECANTVKSNDEYWIAGPAIGKCVPMPNGIRFILGYNMSSMTGGPADPNSRDASTMGFECVSKASGGGTSYTGRMSTIAAVVATGKCPTGEWLRVFVIFSQCWDGKNLDVPDHRSHIVMPPQSRCPQTHPFKVPEIAISAFFTVDANFAKWHLSSDEMMPGIAAGTTLHMDYWEAWSQVIKDLWQKNCVDGPASCSTGNVGDGRMIRGMQQVGDYPNHVTVPVASVP